MNSTKLILIFSVYYLIIILLQTLPRTVTSNKELHMYVTKLHKISNGNIGNMTLIDYSDTLPDGIIANCRYNVFFKDILVNKKYWSRYGELEKTWLIAHELLHCEKNLDHKQGNLPDYCPKYIMNLYKPNSQCIKRHFDMYMYQTKVNK